jgi:hypothetical protein
VKNKNLWILVGALTVVSVGISVWKMVWLGFTPAEVLPVHAYRISVEIEAKANGKDIFIRSFLPVSDTRQQILEEGGESGSFAQDIMLRDANREITWTAEEVTHPIKASYTMIVYPHRQVFKMPGFLSRNQFENSPYARYLQHTRLIEKNSPEILELSERLGLDTLENLKTVVERVYSFTADSIQSTVFSGETSALTTMRLREASCNGKSRLAVALLRQQSIPARLVGGIILQDGRKRTSHQWVEVFMGNQWVPFCPLNRYLFELPAHYLTVYRGDHSMFRRTANIQFEYIFDIEKRVISRPSARQNLLNIWAIFEEGGADAGMLAVLLMIPIGAVITVLFRNMIGLHTFGTFLPALIATSFRDTGLLWGLGSFVLLMTLGVLLRKALEHIKLLHTPRLTILLIFVILGMLSIALFGIHFHIRELSQASLFPIAVLAITIERFSIITEESGWRNSLTMGINTIVVVVFCYLGMMSVFLQTLVLAFPESLLLVLAISLYLGRWTGVRLTEFWRFRRLLWPSNQP